MKRRDGIAGYLFIAPGIIGFLVFVLYPLISSVYFELTDWSGWNSPTFVGLHNFIYMFTVDPSFWPSLRATAIYVFLSVPTGLALGLFLAVLLNRKLPGIRIFRTMYYLPVVLPSVATLTLWKFILDPQYGLANQLLRTLHLPTSSWLQSNVMAMPSIVIIGLWGVGGSMIIFLAGLQTVSSELYEAAQVDGASVWRSFWSVTLPMITPIVFLQLITGIIGAFQAFNQAQILTQGGPNYSTNLLNYSIYDNAFNGHEFGYASAQMWVLFVIIMIFTFITFKFSNQWVYYEADESR
jgi:multiple sugar transport system permease protein